MLINPYVHPLLKERLPWRSGRFLIGVGLRAAQDILDRDQHAQAYNESKLQAIDEIGPSHLIPPFHDLSAQEEQSACSYLNALGVSGPLNFHDQGLAVQEDLALWKCEGEREWLAALHLCSPNHWAPEQKIGKSFREVHGPIPKIEPISNIALRLFKQSYERGIQERLAWGVATDTQLNHHPRAANPGRRFNPSAPELYVRLERQTLSPIPEHSLMLFTIRTYFIDVSTLEAQDRQLIAQCIRSMDQALLTYKGLIQDGKAILAWLEGPA